MKTQFKTDIILLFLLALSYNGMAQRPAKASDEEKMMQAKKTDRGKSALFLGWGFGNNEFFKTKTSSGFGVHFEGGFEYFFINKTSVIGKVGASVFDNRVNNRRELYDHIALRRYFFKRAGLFLEAGGQFGIFRRVQQEEGSNLSFNYIQPAVSIGYEYLITDLHPFFDHHVGLEAAVLTLIPTKHFEMFTIPAFPFYDFHFKIKYHF